MQFKNHTIIVGTNTISYWDNGNVHANNVVILLAPGAFTGEVFADSIKNIQNDTIRFIAPDYPGRGGSHYLCPGSSVLDNCASEIITLLDTLNICVYSILAISFGTMVADSLLKMDTGKCKDCILIAAGEYFNSRQRAILKMLFIPTSIPIAQKIYKKILLFSPVMKSLSKTDLGEIRKQWIETLNYKVDLKRSHNIPCTMFNCQNDKIVNKRSRDSLYSLYPNCSRIVLNLPHPIKKSVIDVAVSQAIMHYSVALQTVCTS